MPGKSTRPKPSRNSARAGLPRPTPSEAAFERAFAALDAAAPTRKSASRPQPQEEPITPERDAFVDRVFSASEQYLRDPYSTIGDATVFNTKLAGVSFEGRQDTIAGLAPGSELTLVRQLANEHDPNAIAAHYGNLQLGFIKRGIAAHLAPRIDAGARYRARITTITGGGDRHRGVNVLVERDAAAEPRGRTSPYLCPRRIGLRSS